MQAPIFRYNQQVILTGTGYHCTVVKVIRHNKNYLYKVRCNGSQVTIVVKADRLFANWALI